MAEKEYIERGNLIESIKQIYCADCNSYNGVRCRACQIGDALDVVEDAPAADVAEVVRCKNCVLRGREDCAMYYRCGCGEQHTWETDSGAVYFCSCCEYFAMPRESREWHFCPNCGAKMGGKK